MPEIPRKKERKKKGCIEHPDCSIFSRFLLLFATTILPEEKEEEDPGKSLNHSAKLSSFFLLCLFPFYGSAFLRFSLSFQYSLSLPSLLSQTLRKKEKKCALFGSSGLFRLPSFGTRSRPEGKWSKHRKSKR